MLANAPTNVDPFYKGAPFKGRVAILGGTNDCLHGTATPAQAWANLNSFGVGRRAKGFKTVVMTIPSINGFDTCRDSINALISANWMTNFDALVDLAADPHIGPDGSFSNATYFQGDGIHFTAFTQQNVIAPLVQTQLNGLP
jgi:hypothetical protein